MGSSLLESQRVAESVRTLFRFGVLSAWSDRELVGLYVSGREGSQFAFEVLIRRHGPMVMGVCRRVLGDLHLAEDAFQATFVVLVRKAGQLRDHELLGNWLHGVAHRVASKARIEAGRRRVREQRDWAEAGDSECVLERGEFQSAIDEEIQRLPERYRVPLVLCYLEGMRHQEVAQRLGCPVGTVESRLSRARERLRTRLARRGFAPAPGALAAALRPGKASVSFGSMVEAALRSATVAARGGGGAMEIAAKSLAKRGGWIALTSRGALAAITLVASLTVLAAGFGAFPLGGATMETRAGLEELMPKRANEHETEEPPSHAFFTAVARPLSGITIDGRLDDWPADLSRYPIRNQLSHNASYRPEVESQKRDPDAHFMAGYDRQTGLLYLAVSVRDSDLVIDSKDALLTDAVEVYVQCGPSGSSHELPRNDAWPSDAAKMPVLQYAAVPGGAVAYADPHGENPALVYGDIGETATRMKHRRVGDVTTYEWAIQVFDGYPDRPTRLRPGLRLGFDVTVVDKDSPTVKPAWICWGPPWRKFKGIDPENLGELILQGDP